MAAGHFYPAPPVFIGGRQPYAPKQGLPQSGPVPQAPPPSSRVRDAVIVASWTPGPPTFIGARQPYAQRLGSPQSGAAAQQAPLDSWWWLDNQAAWKPADPTFIGGQQPYAPRLGMPQSNPADAGAKPLEPYSALDAIAAWKPPELPFIGGRQPVAPRLGIPQDAPAVANPPMRPIGLDPVISSWWASLSVTTITLPSIAPFLADPSQPQPKTLHAFFSIREAWNPQPYALPKLITVAALLAPPPAADAPPRRSYSAQIAVREAWNFPPPRAQGDTRIAPLLPQAVVADAPPPLNRAALYSVRDSWTPAPYALPGSAAFAPLVPLLEGPPRASWANFGTIRQAWEIPPDRVERRSGKSAPLIPPPDNPPVRTNVLMLQIVHSHDPVQWWPLPQFVLAEYMSTSGPATASIVGHRSTVSARRISGTASEVQAIRGTGESGDG